MAQLERLVGERTVPHLWHENYWFRRHEIAYLELAGPVLAAARRTPTVIEAGAGEGYGLRLLHSAGVRQLTGIDYNPSAVAHAHRAYPDAAISRAELTALPLADRSAGAIVCLQVIEHLWAPWEFLAECRRVLAPGGLLAVSTPNRLTFSPGLGRGEKPLNPFHAREFDAAELRGTIGSQLSVTATLGVVHGQRLQEWEAEHGSVAAAQLATAPSGWDPELTRLIGSVTAADFVLAPLDRLDDTDVLDLVVLAEAGG